MIFFIIYEPSILANHKAWHTKKSIGVPSIHGSVQLMQRYCFYQRDGYPIGPILTFWRMNIVLHGYTAGSLCMYMGVVGGMESLQVQSPKGVLCGRLKGPKRHAPKRVP